jgi:hypothetical protein
MPAYLVRIINTRDIVGFFFADDLDDLLTTIDECTEPAGCPTPSRRNLLGVARDSRAIRRDSGR